MSVTLRAGRPEDAVSLAGLATQVWFDTYAIEGMREAWARYVFDTFTPDHFKALLVDIDRRLIVAAQDNNLLGYVLLGKPYSCPIDGYPQATEIETLYVSRHFHGRGVGRALVAEARAYVRAASGAGLWLKTWFRNANALAFYRAVGFVDVGITHFELEGARHENRVLVDVNTCEPRA